MFLRFQVPVNIVIDSQLWTRTIGRNSLSFLALVGLWIIFLWDAFGADRSFALRMDNEFFVGTVLSSMSTTLSNGEWPLRMDTILGGVPLYNFSQLSPFYPFYLVALPIFSNPFDVVQSLHWITLLHILIFEINMYLFLRVIGASRLGALTGAALTAFSANSFAYAVWVNIVAPYAWLPLYLAGLVGVLKFPQSIRFSVLALGGIILLTLASPAQPLIHAVFITVIFVCLHCLSQLRHGSKGQVLYTLLRVLAVGLFAALLLAPVILPVALEFENMIRWIGPFPPVMGNAPIPFAAFQFDQLSIADLGGVFFKSKNAAVGSQFVGLVAVALACVAVVSRPRSWIIISLTFIAVYSLISSTGSNLGLAYLNYIIPILNKIREPSRFLVLFQFAACVLAALGIDELRKTILREEGSASAKWQLIALALTAMIAIIALLKVPVRFETNVTPYVTVMILLALILLTWIATHSNLCGNTIVAVIWSGAALSLLSLEVPWTPPPISSSQYLTTGALALDTAIQRVASLDSDREYRVIFDGEIDKQQAAMLASYRNVRTLNAYFNPAPRRQFEELYYHGPRENSYFRILGAKYLICIKCKSESLNGYMYSENIAGYEIYEAKEVLPRSYIAHRTDGEIIDLTDVLAKSRAAVPTQKPLLVKSNVVAGSDGGGRSTGEDICISREDIRTTNRSRFTVQCKSSGVLVLNEFFDVAWRASVDGTKTQSLRVNGNQIGIPFSPGSHVIEFRYLPTVFLASLALQFVGVLLICMLIARRFLK